MARLVSQSRLIAWLQRSLSSSPSTTVHMLLAIASIRGHIGDAKHIEHMVFS